MKVVAAFNQEKTLAGAFSVITNLQMELFEALVNSCIPRRPGPGLMNLILSRDNTAQPPAATGEQTSLKQRSSNGGLISQRRWLASLGPADWRCEVII